MLYVTCICLLQVLMEPVVTQLQASMNPNTPPVQPLTPILKPPATPAGRQGRWCVCVWRVCVRGWNVVGVCLLSCVCYCFLLVLFILRV